MGDTQTGDPVTLFTDTSSSSSTTPWNGSSTTTSFASEEDNSTFPQSNYCYPINRNLSDDTLVTILLVLFLVLLLTAIIWRIITGIQMIRRYRAKITILTSGPILDATYFENAPPPAFTSPASPTAAPAPAGGPVKSEQQQQSQPPPPQPASNPAPPPQ